MASLSAAALPTGARGRALAVAVTLVVALVAWLGVISPLVDFYDTGAEAIAQRRALAGRMRDLADSLPDLRKQAAAAGAQGAPAAALLEGASDAVAAANLQSFLETMCTGAGAKLTSTEALPAEQTGLYRRIGLRVSVDANWSQLTHLLRAVQQAMPRMFVDDLQLHAQPANDQTHELPLDIALTVLAFRLPGAAPPATADTATDAVTDTGGSSAEAPPVTPPPPDAPPIDAPADPRAAAPVPAPPPMAAPPAAPASQ